MKEESPKISIRRATENDAPLLASLAAATFTATFGHLYTTQDLRVFLAESHSIDSWKQTLADPARATWLAELQDATAIAFITAGACKLPVENREAMAGEIQMLYVLQQYQNLRLGARLMAVGLEWLQEQGRTPLYIGVWSENLGAQRFYGRYGFEKAGEYGFPVGDTVDREFILKRTGSR